METLFVVQTTTESVVEAEKLIQSVINKWLCACVQQEPIKSSYVRDWKLTTVQEIKLTFKTTLVKNLVQHIIKVHTYDTPELFRYEVWGTKSYVDRAISQLK